jgi:hypothetical protein
VAFSHTPTNKSAVNGMEKFAFKLISHRANGIPPTGTIQTNKEIIPMMNVTRHPCNDFPSFWRIDCIMSINNKKGNKKENS